MKLKELLKTKSFYSGLALVLYGFARLGDDTNEGIQSILTGLSVIFLRDAIAKTERQ